MLILKYSYSGYGISLSSCNTFSKNQVIFDSDMSLSVHIDNKKIYILISCKGSMQERDDYIDYRIRIL